MKEDYQQELEKLQSLGVRAFLVLSRPAKKPNVWVSEVLKPRCQLTETSRSCQKRIQDLFDILIQGNFVQFSLVFKDLYPCYRYYKALPSLEQSQQAVTLSLIPKASNKFKLTMLKL